MFFYNDILKSIVLKHRWVNRFKKKEINVSINDNREEESDDDGQKKYPECDSNSPIRHYIMQIIGNNNEAFS